MLVELKAQLISAIKSNDIAARDILRLVIGDMELAPKLTDDISLSIIRKHVKNINEAMQFVKLGDDGYDKLHKQLSILNCLLPTTLSIGAIQALFLNSDGPEIEQIASAKSDGQAMGIAMKFLKTSGAVVSSEDVKSVVGELRSGS